MSPLAARLLLAVLLSAPLLADAALPWKSGDAAPAVASIHLGDDRAQLDKLLGDATDVQDLGPDSFMMLYREQGLALLYSSQDGVEVVYLMSPTAGDIDGIHVGDTRDAVLAKWGEPSSVDGPEAQYRVGQWVVALQLGPEQKIVRLSLGRTSNNSARH